MMIKDDEDELLEDFVKKMNRKRKNNKLLNCECEYDTETSREIKILSEVEKLWIINDCR